MKRKHITSRENPLYKDIRQIANSSQARRKSGRTLLDGVHLCEAYLHSIGFPPLCLVGEGALQHAEVGGLIDQCEAGSGQLVVLPDQMFAQISQVEHGVGIMFVVDTPVVAVPDALTMSAVLLDDLQDPGNLGSILRSAAAAGIEYVFCSPGTAFAWSPKVLRAGMGAHFILKIVEHADLAGLIARARIPVLATSSHARRRIYDADLKDPVAWLFGHEGQGVSEALMQAATETVAIPHLGKVESLNVAACAAVCLFEQVRQKAMPA